LRKIAAQGGISGPFMREQNLILFSSEFHMELVTSLSLDESIKLKEGEAG
jgi:hypothetical protein